MLIAAACKICILISLHYYFKWRAWLLYYIVMLICTGSSASRDFAQLCLFGQVSSSVCSQLRWPHFFLSNIWVWCLTMRVCSGSCASTDIALLFCLGWGHTQVPQIWFGVTEDCTICCWKCKAHKTCTESVGDASTITVRTSMEHAHSNVAKNLLLELASSWYIK